MANTNNKFERNRSFESDLLCRLFWLDWDSFIAISHRTIKSNLDKRNRYKLYRIIDAKSEKKKLKAFTSWSSWSTQFGMKKRYQMLRTHALADGYFVTLWNLEIFSVGWPCRAENDILSKDRSATLLTNIWIMYSTYTFELMSLNFCTNSMDEFPGAIPCALWRSVQFRNIGKVVCGALACMQATATHFLLIYNDKTKECYVLRENLDKTFRSQLIR